MSMLDRYKKLGGFLQLLQLIETSPPKKQEQFLQLVGAESKVWEETLRKKILIINRVFNWPPQYLVEILTRLPPLTLAGALQDYNESEIDVLLSCLPVSSKRKIIEMFRGLNPNSGEKQACEMRILSEVRSLIHQGVIKLEKVDPEYACPENIEEILAKTPVVVPVNTEQNGALDFSLADHRLPTANLDSASSPSISIGSASEDELKNLRKKINGLTLEVNSLKHDNSMLRDKLAQIKKVAS